jgi:hypothetical protein
MREKKKPKKAAAAKEKAPAAAKKEKVGFIFECGRNGPDYEVAGFFLGRLNPQIEIVPRFLDNAERLLNECGEIAAELLKECSRIVIMWDLEPAWGGKACRHDDKECAIKSLDGAKVDKRKVLLLCVEKELECWLMADKRAIEAVLGRYKPSYYIGKIPEFKDPDTQIKRPKTELISLFENELGSGRKYVDRTHAMLLARAIPDWSRISRSVSFCRFANKAARVKL